MLKSNKRIFIALIYFVVLWMACKDVPQDHKSASITDGNELAKIHCARCHVQPLPDALSKKSWQNGVFPEMAYYLGMTSSGDKMFNMAEDEYEVLKTSGLFPNEPLMTPEQWDSLKAYYINNAPDTLALTFDANLDRKRDFISKLMVNPSNRNASVTLLEFDTISNHLFAFIEETNTLNEYNNDFSIVNEVKLESPVSDIVIKDNQKFVLQMGIMNPNDRKKGKLSLINAGNTVTDLVDSLKRPVDVNTWDINGDGTDDFIICSFGNLAGDLSWFDGKTFEKHIISAASGARISYTRDIDGDGKEELIALFCQGDEKISVFHKSGDSFTEEVLMRFPPNYGSSFIDLQDINNDGLPDILYTNGDNADLSIETKPYHGFTIYLNEGKNKFSKSYFYSYPGCAKVVAMDFDKDGDLDYGLISFFPDKLKNGFVFLEQTSPNKYKANTMTNGEKGKWMVMSANFKNNAFFLGSYNRNTTIPGQQIQFMKLQSSGH